MYKFFHTAVRTAKDVLSKEEIKLHKLKYMDLVRTKEDSHGKVYGVSTCKGSKLLAGTMEPTTEARYLVDLNKKKEDKGSAIPAKANR